MKKYFLSLLFCFILTSLTGCIETKDTYYINPDGSGKVKHEATLQGMNFNMNNSNEKPDPQKNAKKMVLAELEQSQGIDVWSDVSWEALAENSIHFTGTAYFKNIHNLKFHNSGFTFALLNEYILQTKNNEMILTLKNKDQVTNKETVSPKDLDDIELETLVQSAKQQLDNNKTMLSAALASMKVEKTFHLPGTWTTSSNFEKIDNNQFKIAFTGTNIISLFETYINSDDWIKADILQGRDPVKEGPDDQAKINQILFGEKDIVHITMQNAHDTLFNYEQEVSAAQESYETLFQTLGATITKKIDPTLAGEFMVGGARVVFESDQENDVRPFNYDKGLTLSIIGHLPQEVTQIKGGQIINATTDLGQSLLHETDWDNEIKFANISKDKNIAIFDVNLQLPNKAATSITTIEGTLQYAVAKETKTVDLGINFFNANQQGKVYNALIEKIAPDPWNLGQQIIDLKLEITVDQVEEIRIYDENRNPISFNQGYSAFDDVVTFNLSIKETSLPTHGSIEIDIHEGFELFEIPFKINNISLFRQQ